MILIMEFMDKSVFENEAVDMKNAIALISLMVLFLGLVGCDRKTVIFSTNCYYSCGGLIIC